MKSQIAIICMLAVARTCDAEALKVEVTPVQKVIQLLNGMLEKGKKEKHEEEVMFAASRQFCGDNQKKAALQIKEELSTMQGLEALIAKNSADANHLMKLIQTLDADEDVWSGDIKAATKVRQIEKADYDKTHKDYSESIKATQHAVEVLKKQAYDRKQAPAFAQISSLSDMKLFPDSARKTLSAFLQQGDKDLDEMAPEANAAEFQSQGVVDMLNKLTDKFVDERTALEKEEVNAKHAYTMLMQDLKSQIQQAVKDKHSRQLSKSKKLALKADEQGDLKQTQRVESDDEKYLSKLKASCTMKAGDFKARQELRAGEIIALEKAIEVLSSNAVSGNAKKHLPGFIQNQGTALLELRSSLNTQTQMQMRVSQFLQDRARKFNSRMLAALSQRVTADPFTKVKKMIKDLVVKLMEEANEEADHKGWCDTELSTNQATRKEKTDAVETLHAQVDSLEASISKLTDDIGALSKSIADLDAAVAKATKMRTEEKKKNTETISDANDAQAAVAQALTVIKEFYAKAGEATAFIQQPYKGMQEQSGGVVGMLEVIASDFARLESETKAAEATAQKEYDAFSTDSKVSKAAKSTEMEHKAAKKQGEAAAVTATKADLEGTQKELNAALSYYDKLKPTCVDAGVSYEERVARRKEEIQSMQEGLRILNGEDIA